jgi:hypothetical protein
VRLFWPYVEMVGGELKVAGGGMWWDGEFAPDCGNIGLFVVNSEQGEK